MRSTIVFLTLLVFMSCTKIDSFDSVLLEMSSDPRSEAIFATMAVQLKTRGGFDRVIALLNQLVEDSKSQLHDSNKLFKATDARCDVDTARFAEKQTYYENRYAQLSDAVAAANEEKAYAENTLKAIGEANTIVSEFLKAEKERHAEDRTLYEQRVNNAKDAVKHAEDAIKAVNEWNSPSQSSFVQTKLNNLSASYLQVKSFQLVIPKSFVQLAATDDQVKNRLQEWLTSLRLTLLDAQSELEATFTSHQESWGTLEKAAQELIDEYDKDSKTLKTDSAIFETTAKNFAEAQEGVVTLRNQNSGLVDANKSYCTTERGNYDAAKKNIEEQIRLFKEIRTYFRGNYEKINQFIKDKYKTASQ